jgi:hypothetical protein
MWGTRGNLVREIVTIFHMWATRQPKDDKKKDKKRDYKRKDRDS